MTRLAEPPPAASRARRATFSYISMMMFTLVTVVTGLFATPWLTRWLGDERFGAARVLAEYAGYLALLDLGLGGALSPLLSRALAEGDERRLRGVMAAGLRLYLFVTATILVVGFVATPWIPRLVRVPPGLFGDVRLAWAFTVLAFLPLALAPLRALTEAEQRSYVINSLLIVQAVVLTALALALAYAGMGVTGQAVTVATTTALFGVTVAAAALRRHPDCLRGLREPPDLEARAALRKLSGPALTVNVAGRISLLSDGIIVSLFLGPARVTVLYATQRLAALAQAQLQGVGNASWAALADLHARGEHEVFGRRLVELTRLVAILGASALAPIVAFNARFLELWLPGRDGGPAIVVVAAINALILAVTSLWLWVFTATRRIGLMVRPLVASAAINVAASLLLTRALGPVGPLLGTLVAYLSVQAWCLPARLSECFGVPARQLAWAALAPVLVGVPYAALLWWLARAWPAPGWISLAAEAGASALLALAFGAAVLLDETDRAIWRARLAGMFPRRFRGAR